MRILIGILYTCENEYEACRNAITRQTHRDHDCIVIKNKPNKEAHDLLYSVFMDHSSEYGLFIKIDADMVLSRNTFLDEVIGTMNKFPDIDCLQIAVHDFFTDSLILGLNVFRSSVRWRIEGENIFVDRTMISNRSVIDFDMLAPAAFHCPDPSLFQSFHYGVHKAVKIYQPESVNFNIEASRTHWRNILATHAHFLISKDERVRHVLFGYYAATRYSFDSKNVDFNDTELHRIFESFSDPHMRLRAEAFIERHFSRSSAINHACLILRLFRYRRVTFPVFNRYLITKTLKRIRELFIRTTLRNRIFR